MLKSRHLSDQMAALSSAQDAEIAKRISVCRYEIEAAGNCEKPVGFSSDGRPDQDRRGGYTFIPGGKSEIPLFLDGEGRCRKCGPCRKARAAIWTLRASMETRLWPRTWFMTFTMTPADDFRFLEITRERLWQKAVHFEQLSLDEQFTELCVDFGRELQLMMKRLRKNTEAPLRYITVFEPHKSGEPHAHMLLHECDFEKPVTKKTLQEEWAFGYTKCKLADAGAPYYICKYISKDARTRIRASYRYGSGGTIFGGSVGRTSISDPSSQSVSPRPQGASAERLAPLSNEELRSGYDETGEHQAVAGASKLDIAAYVERLRAARAETEEQP